MVDLFQFSSLHVKKLVEFIYTGMTSILTKDEDLFTSLLMNLEIGGTKQSIIIIPADEAMEGDEIIMEVNKSVNSAEGLKSLKWSSFENKNWTKNALTSSSRIKGKGVHL